MSARPDEVGEKKDDHNRATRFELLEEAGEQVAENKQFKPGSKRRFGEVQYAGTFRLRDQTRTQYKDHNADDPCE